jgi:archaellum component FlaC
MAENVDNLVLEQLRLIRETLGQMQDEIKDMRRDFNDKIENVTVKVNANTAILIGFGHYIHSIDERVEHLEKIMGVEA